MSKAKQDGGAAFPVASGGRTDAYGMTLRDWISWNAMVGIMEQKNYDWFVNRSDAKARIKEAAYLSYFLADAMIAARSARSGDAAKAAEGRKLGMREAAEIARECWNNPMCEADAEYIPNAILAEMEALK